MANYLYTRPSVFPQIDVYLAFLTRRAHTRRIQITDVFFLKIEVSASGANHVDENLHSSLAKTDNWLRCIRRPGAIDWVLY